MDHAREYQPDRHHEAFAHSNVAMGAGHWLKTAGILAPLIIGEFVKDPDRRWRYARIASVTTALISEGLHASRINRQRQCPERGGR